MRKASKRIILANIYARASQSSSLETMSFSKVGISFASVPYDRMQPLQSGEVKAEGVDLNFISVNHPRDIFDRMSGGKEFDSSELSLSE